MSVEKITIEKAQPGEYPPGEEWRGKIREAVKLLVTLPDDQWVKVVGIEPTLLNRARSAAHAIAAADWDREFGGGETIYQLITKYDRENQTLWLGQQRRVKDEEE